MKTSGPAELPEGPTGRWMLGCCPVSGFTFFNQTIGRSHFHRSAAKMLASRNPFHVVVVVVVRVAESHLTLLTDETKTNTELKMGGRRGEKSNLSATRHIARLFVCLLCVWPRRRRFLCAGSLCTLTPNFITSRCRLVKSAGVAGAPRCDRTISPWWLKVELQG